MRIVFYKEILLDILLLSSLQLLMIDRIEQGVESRFCPHCSAPFDITNIDADFLERLAPTLAGKKISLPFPTHCPECRRIRRYAWRNENNIYKRVCDATGKSIISLFSPDAPCPVYESAYWYSDKWDAKQYGKIIVFSILLRIP